MLKSTEMQICTRDFYYFSGCPIVPSKQFIDFNSFQNGHLINTCSCLSVNITFKVLINDFKPSIIKGDEPQMIWAMNI